MFTANCYPIFIASPSDVAKERELIKKEIIQWNDINAQYKNIVLLPLTWEDNIASGFEKSGQDKINETLLEKAELMIAVFWSKVGTPSKKFISATVEEIEYHLERNKPLMIFFCDRPFPIGLDTKQIELVKEIKEKYQLKGIYKPYSTLEDFSAKISKSIQLKLNERNDIFTGYNPESLISSESDKKFQPQILYTKVESSAPQLSLELKWVGGLRMNRGIAFNNDFSQQPLEAHKVNWAFEISNRYKLFLKNTSEFTAWNIQVINASELFSKFKPLEPLASLKSNEALIIEVEYIQDYNGKGLDADKQPKIPEDFDGKVLKIQFKDSKEKNYEADYLLKEGKFVYQKINIV
ncbi:MAG: hypothetical protein ABJB05_11495 [Parafilimonas sp.]